MRGYMVLLLLMIPVFGACQVAPVPEPVIEWMEDPSKPPVPPPPPPGGHDSRLAALPLTKENARRVIVEATVWAPDGIGFGSEAHHTPRQAMKLLLEQPGAGDLFESLYQRAGTPGRLLTLCALHLGKDPRFERLAGPFVGSKEQVTAYISSCIGESRSAGDILAEISTTDACRDNPHGNLR